MARRSKRSNATRKLLRVPQTAVNTALGIVGATGKGSVRVVRRAGKGAFGITGTALGTTRNVSKAAINTASNVGVRATRGVSRLMKNSIDLAANLTTGVLKGVKKSVNGRTRRHRRR
jgi:hypothetical protein